MDEYSINLILVLLQDDKAVYFELDKVTKTWHYYAFSEERDEYINMHSANKKNFKLDVLKIMIESTFSKNSNLEMLYL